MFSQIQNEVVMDWAMGMEWWKSKDSADDVVVFKEDLILPHEYWVGRDGMVRPPQEHLPTLPQTPAHSGHCLLTRQSLHRKGENGMICHPSADLGQTGRKSGLLPLLSLLTIILSTSNPSDLAAIIVEIEGLPKQKVDMYNSNLAYVLTQSHADSQNGLVRPLVPLSPKRCIMQH